MSDAVERKLIRLLNNPTISPYGNPIPGLDQLEEPNGDEPSDLPRLELGLQRLDEFARRGGGTVEVRRIAEHVQADADLMTELKAAGIVPGQDVQVSSIPRFGEAVPVHSEGEQAAVQPLLAHAVLVRAR
jgi:DtxR family Mn-dependent transcriptional regulator